MMSRPGLVAGRPGLVGDRRQVRCMKSKLELAGGRFEHRQEVEHR